MTFDVFLKLFVAQNQIKSGRERREREREEGKEER